MQFTILTRLDSLVRPSHEGMMRAAAIIAIVSLAVAAAALLPATDPPAPALAHAGYGSELPRGCRFVIRIVVVNGIEIPLRYVVCPPASAAKPAVPIG